MQWSSWKWSQVGKQEGEPGGWHRLILVLFGHLVVQSVFSLTPDCHLPPNRGSKGQWFDAWEEPPGPVHRFIGGDAPSADAHRCTPGHTPWCTPVHPRILPAHSSTTKKATVVPMGAEVQPTTIGWLSTSRWTLNWKQFANFSFFFHWIPHLCQVLASVASLLWDIFTIQRGPRQVNGAASQVKELLPFLPSLRWEQHFCPRRHPLVGRVQHFDSLPLSTLHICHNHHNRWLCKTIQSSVKFSYGYVKENALILHKISSFTKHVIYYTTSKCVV